MLNIAEGAGEFAAAEKARFYRIAIRSATETAAALDLAMSLEIIGVEEGQKIRGQLAEVISMLTRMVRNLRGE